MAMPALADPSMLDQSEAALWRWTNKALDRLAEHPFSELEVMTAVMHPATTERAQSPGLLIHRRGACAAVVDPDKKVVITVLDLLAGQRRPQRTYFPPVVRPRPAVAARPSPVRALPDPVPADPREIKNMAARVRLLNAAHSDIVPSIAGDWLPNVCLPRLRDYPGRWALILVAPFPRAATAWEAQVRETHPELETAVRGVNVYARCAEW